MRKLIGLVLSLALIAVGIYLLTIRFGFGLPYIEWTAPILIGAGLIWIWSDWYEVDS